MIWTLALNPIRRPSKMLTELQQDRCVFHLDLDARYGILAIDNKLRLYVSDINRELTVVGNLETALPENIIQIEGEDLCTISSVLGRVETAYNRLSPTVIDDSLLVKKAGKVELRADELRARTRLYESTLKELRKALGVCEDDQRASLRL